VEPAAEWAELLSDCVDECRRVVVQAGLELGDALRRGSHCALANLGDDVAWDRADLGPPLECRQLHFEPARQLAFVRPDACHGRSRVAGDH
jgi:hypothetical protein